MVTYATAMSVEASVKYNHIHAEAAQAITTAQIYLQAAEMQPDPQPPAPVTQTQNTNPDDLMDVGEQTPAGVATENHLGTEIVDEQVLELNVPQDNMDLLCKGIVENPFEPSTTGDLRDRKKPLHHTSTEVDPVVDDVEMAENPQGEPDAPPEEEIVNKTIWLEPQDNGEAQIPNPQTNEPGWKVWKICRRCSEKGHVLESCPMNVNEPLNLTAAQLYHLGQKNNCIKDATWVKGAKTEGTKIDQLADSFQGLTPKSGPNSPAKPLPPPAQPIQSPGDPDSANHKKVEERLRERR